MIVEVGNEDLDDDAGVQASDGLDCLAEVFGATIGQIIPGDRSEDEVFEAHAVCGLGDPKRFVEF